ncbi:MULTISPECIES: MBL fold metallo-hydrolase [Arthrobacter]|uniref:MBL fold metallo-hydrolase n=1 Tax=unclassified Arthrobacter TaxID=235627 RepID=UPI0024B909D5|nr:MBL fold metallo-hydrolase [Arthrobacter sp. H35-MC1]MDJ0316354.1 MBL fold metallo-hydrolase [Arthrobacter sp. H35-MC1]
MKLTIVGCSGSFPGPSSPASCYLLTAHDGVRPWRVLMDLGSGALGAAQKYMDLEDIDAIFLSHLHPDHCMDLCGLHVAVRWNPHGWHRGRIPVWGPAETADRLATAYGLELDPGMREEFDFRNWQERSPVTVGPFTVTPYAVNHPVPEAYALRVEVKEYDGTGLDRTTVLTYSGDTDSCQGLEDAAKNAHLFLCEAAFEEGRDDHIKDVHLSGKRAGEAAARANVKRLLLTHIPVWTDTNKVVAEAGEVYAGDVAAAVAGVHYTI